MKDKITAVTELSTKSSLQKLVFHSTSTSDKQLLH